MHSCSTGMKWQIKEILTSQQIVQVSFVNLLRKALHVRKQRFRDKRWPKTLHCCRLPAYRAAHLMSVCSCWKCMCFTCLRSKGADCITAHFQQFLNKKGVRSWPWRARSRKEAAKCLCGCCWGIPFSCDTRRHLRTSPWNQYLPPDPPPSALHKPSA